MPNIDRDDENATRHEVHPTIDEQMCVYSGCDFPRAPCIGNCKRITEAAIGNLRKDKP